MCLAGSSSVASNCLLSFLLVFRLYVSQVLIFMLKPFEIESPILTTMPLLTPLPVHAGSGLCSIGQAPCREWPV